jgi:ribosomal-protein-alanine N-acetyltransferase
MTSLETDRLVLRRLAPDDFDALARIFNNPNVMKYLGLEGSPMSREETETFLHSINRHWERHGFGRWIVVAKENNQVIGCSGLRSYEGTAELVYLIDEPYWDKGLATEIARACLEFGFTRRGFQKIIAFARPGNAPSRKVMEKIGMRFVLETTVFGVFVVQYEILREDYRPDQPVAAAAAEGSASEPE